MYKGSPEESRSCVHFQPQTKKDLIAAFDSCMDIDADHQHREDVDPMDVDPNHQHREDIDPNHRHREDV